jgi:hypothetical protein
MMREAAPVAPGRWLLDLLSPRVAQRRRVGRDAERYLAQLLDVNAARVEGDLRDRVRESRRELEARVRRVLRSVYEIADRALARARATHAAGIEATSAELDRLREIGRTLDGLQPEGGP